MRAEGGIFTPSREVDELRWLPVAEAMGLLSQPRDLDLLKKFAETPVATKAVLLVRHAMAGNRSDWKGDDNDRPLDDAGRQQAEALVWLLTRFDVREIVSAPLARCTQTVAPLAVAVGLSVREEPLLAEETYPGREREALKFIRSVGTASTGTVLCSQGGVIPDILRRLGDEDVPGPAPRQEGQRLVAHLRRRQVVRR